ncbi:hypothetical protein DV451_000676 [Geotrichum candidum]|uniref:HIT domain-containing protein n=1 Tax=Geotrichum candidum TaxID=1173061 RepID=A0A9P5G853_GEOCN|nr:hypothetical protein DV451_000676 [Geotrichum candidum]
MDIGPTSPGHALIIPKYHGAKLHDIPDEYLAEILPITKRIAIALNLNHDQGAEKGDGYNILQNNGRIAHQEVDHVHFHIIPKYEKNPELGLGVGWPQSAEGKEKVKDIHAKLVEAIKPLGLDKKI